MASASPVAILALPDRAVAERPESKPGDAGDGRFAGLMAQFAQSQTTPSAVDPARGPSARAHRSAARRAAPAPAAPHASAEVSHPAAAASAPKAGTPSPLRTTARAPRQHPSEAQAADPQAAVPQVSSQDTPAAAAAPATAPLATDSQTPPPEPPAQSPLTAPAVLLPPETIPAPKVTPVEASAVLVAAPGPAAAVAAKATLAPGLPSLPGDPQQPTGASKAALTLAPTAVPTAAPTDIPPTFLEVAPPKAAAQAADPAFLQVGPEEPGTGLQVTRGTEQTAPGPGAKLAPSPAAEPMAGKPSLLATPGAEATTGQVTLKVSGTPRSLGPAATKPAPDLQAIANHTLDGTSLDLRSNPSRVLEVPAAVPTPAPPPARDSAPLAAKALPAPAVAPEQQTTTPGAEPALPQVILPGPGASLKGTGVTEDPAPSAVPQTTPPAATATDREPLVPAALPQALAQVPAKAALHPGAEAQGPIGQAPFKASGAPVSIDPAERKPAPDLQSLASRTLDGASRALRGTPQRVAEAPAPPAVAATALAASPQPAPDAAAPDTEALAATEANPAPKNSAQSAAPALLQAIPAGPGAIFKGTRGTEDPAPGAVAKTAPPLAAEPTPGEPLVPAALPQQLAPLPAKAALQPGTEAQGPSGQAPLKAGGAPVSLDLAETKPAPDLLALANRTLDGAALAPGTPQCAPEGLTAPAPAAAPPPSQPAAAPPSAPVLQVEGGLRWMLKSGAQEAQLQLHPDALGQVTIHLKVEGGEVHAKVWVSEAASVLAVKEGQPHLEQALKEQGLHLGSFDLQQGHRPFQEAPSAPMLRERGLPETPVARQEAPAPPPVAVLNPHHVELYA